MFQDSRRLADHFNQPQVLSPHLANDAITFFPLNRIWIHFETKCVLRIKAGAFMDKLDLIPVTLWYVGCVSASESARCPAARVSLCPMGKSSFWQGHLHLSFPGAPALRCAKTPCLSETAPDPSLGLDHHFHFQTIIMSVCACVCACVRA